jgi:kinesin family protein 14
MFFESLFTQKVFRTELQKEDSRYQDSKKMVNLAPEFLKLKHCLEKTIQIIMSALRGIHSKWNL